MLQKSIDPNVEGMIHKISESIFDEFQAVNPGKTMNQSETKECGKLLTRVLNTWFIDDRD